MNLGDDFRLWRQFLKARNRAGTGLAISAQAEPEYLLGWLGLEAISGCREQRDNPVRFVRQTMLFLFQVGRQGGRNRAPDGVVHSLDASEQTSWQRVPTRRP